MKIKTHVDFVDALLGGGLLSGKVHLHLSLIGCGKTTLATQLAVETIKYAHMQRRKCRVLYVDPESNVLARANFASCAAWLPRQTAQNAALTGSLACLSSQPDNEYERIVQAGTSISPDSESNRFRYAAMLLNDSLEYCSGKDVRHFQTLLREEPVNLIIIDGLNLYASELSNQSSRHDALTYAIEHLQLIAEVNCCPVWVTHQLNGRQNIANPVVPDPTAISGLKNIWSLVENGVISGALDEWNQAVFTTPKGEPKVVCYLRRDFYRWSLVTGTEAPASHEIPHPRRPSNDYPR